MRRLWLGLVFVAGTLGPAWALDQGGSVETTASGYAEGDPAFQAWFRATYGLEAEPRPWLFVKLAAIFELDSHGEIRRDRLYDETDRDPARAPFRFRDLALGFRAGATTIVIGRQRLTWKRATFVNAADNLSPRDWTDPLDEARLSPWAVDVAWEQGRWSLEGALVPRFAPSRLPQLNGRWFEAPVPGVELAWGEASFPPVSWDTLQGAVRAGYRGPDGELRVSYFRGFDDAPRIAPVLTTLDRSFARLEVAGVDGEVLLGAFIVRAEAGYFHYPSGVDDGYGLGQVELEWSRGNWRLIGGMGDAIGGDPSSSAPASLDLAFLPAVFIHVERGETTEWQVALDAMVGTNEFDHLVRLSGSYPFAGHLRAGGEYDFMHGGPATFWGRWRANDRLRVFLRFDY